MEAASKDNLPIYTIGYGARTLDAFFGVLLTHGITHLVDVRSAPYSKFKPEFSKTALEAAAATQGIRYLFLGDALGGQPKDESCYEDGKVLYDRLRERAFFLDGIRRLEKARALGLRVVVMCSEGKPQECHRTALIGQALADMGIPLAHIDENDGIVDQDEAVARRTGGQLSLLDDPEFKSRKRYTKKREAKESDQDD